MAILKHGINAFSLTIYNIKTELPEFSGVKPLLLVLILEQYLIFTLKPSFNDIILVGGVPSYNGFLAGNNLKKPLYVYNYDFTLLLYIAESQKDFIATIPISKETIRTALNNDSLLLGLVHLSREIVANLTINLIFSLYHKTYKAAKSTEVPYRFFFRIKKTGAGERKRLNTQ